MADKGKRIASRQAQLKRKRRRGKGRPRQFEAGPSERTEPAPDSSEAVVSGAKTQPTSVATGGSVERPPRTISQESARSNPGGPAVGRRAVAGKAEGTLTYPYLGVELRHIGVLTVALAGVLVVLTIFLR